MPAELSSDRCFANPLRAGKFNHPNHGSNRPGGSDALGNSQQSFPVNEERNGISVEIPLSPELLETLHRRGRRRLYEVQEQYGVSVQLHRARGVLLVCGSEKAIKDVQRHLETATPRCRDVVQKVWAELMRTRSVADPGRSAVARLQRESGCRIHIERSLLEVQLFGPNEGVALIGQLLDQLERDCTMEVVPLPGFRPYAVKLEQIANTVGVTIVVEDLQVVVFGRNGPVATAVQELQLYVSNPGLLGVEDMGECGSFEGSDARSPSERVASEAKDGMVLTSEMPSGYRGFHQIPTKMRSTMDGVNAPSKLLPGRGLMDPPASPGAARSSHQGNMRANNQGPKLDKNSSAAAFCSNCGHAARGAFCTQCGQSVRGPAQGTMPMPMQTYMVPPDIRPLNQRNGMGTAMQAPSMPGSCMSVMQPCMMPSNMVFQMMPMPTVGQYAPMYKYGECIQNDEEIGG